MSAPVWRLNRIWVPWAVVVVAVVIDLAPPTAVSSAALLIAAPVAAAPLLGPVGIVLVGAASMAVHAWLARVDHTFGWEHGVANQRCLVAVTVLSVWLSNSVRL